MRLTVSALGALGIMMVALSVFVPWLAIDYGDVEVTHPLTYFSRNLNYVPDSHSTAYAISLYIIVVGLAISLSSLLGGFFLLAGICVFTLGRLTGDSLYSGGSGLFAEVDVSLGFGFFLALGGAMLVLISIKYPLDVAIGGSRLRPRLRTWHLNRE